jgi:hypothetical protein
MMVIITIITEIKRDCLKFLRRGIIEWVPKFKYSVISFPLCYNPCSGISNMLLLIRTASHSRVFNK